jgi:hypothetical protein
MKRYVLLKLTIPQAQAALNACDLIAEQLRADGENKREAELYQRASDTIERQLSS